LWRARPELAVSGIVATPQRLDSCDVVEPWMTSIRGLASYRVPRVDVLVSATLRSTRTNASGDVASNGSALAANYQLPNTVVQQYLGRLPAGQLATGTTTVNLLPAASLYPLQRMTQFDMRFAKTVKVGRTRYDIGVDLYNLFNANTATAYDQAYLYGDNGATTWLRPTSITAPRLARFNVTMNF